MKKKGKPKIVHPARKLVFGILLALILTGVLWMILLIINLAFGTVAFGSQNWISIGGLTFQPSEIVKIVFIFVGAASLNELQQRRNLLIFMGFSVFCLGCLAIMGDFGTAIIFFATYLVISFLRSGDFTKLFLVIGAAGLMGLMVLRFKPYIADRFAVWHHVWEDPTDAGFQQVQTMTSIASGGIPGLGAGEGNLSDVAAASTDLVFGMLAEEWGLVIAVLSVLCIITLGIYALWIQFVPPDPEASAHQGTARRTLRRHHRCPCPLGRTVGYNEKRPKRSQDHWMDT